MTFLLIGAGIGVLGTMVGAGGGFLAVPLLLLLFNATPTVAAGTSLVMVACNAAAGSISYALQRRIDYRAGLVYAMATLPGSLAGVMALPYIPARAFQLAMGIVLMAISVFMFLRPAREERREGGSGAAAETAAAREAEHKVYSGAHRDGQDRRGYPPVTGPGVALSFIVGFVSSLLGIGGGIIHVPALIYLLGYTTHEAVATSHFILAISATAGAVGHVASGHASLPTGLLLGAGAAVGAPFGARLARRLPARQIVLALAAVLVMVAVRLIIRNLG